MKLSIIICVFNEINTIEKILEKIDFVKLPFDYEKKWKAVIESNAPSSNVELTFDLSNQLSPSKTARVFIERNEKEFSCCRE